MGTKKIIGLEKIFIKEKENRHLATELLLIEKFLLLNMKKNETKPVMLYAAEAIYTEILKIKKKESKISNIEAMEIYFGSNHCNNLGNGEFHNNLVSKLKEKELLTDENIKLLEIQKKNIMENLSFNYTTYYAKSSFPLSNSQNALGLIWRMCESYELWCKEVGYNDKIVLNII